MGSNQYAWAYTCVFVHVCMHLWHTHFMHVYNMWVKCVHIHNHTHTHIYVHMCVYADLKNTFYIGVYIH